MAKGTDRTAQFLAAMTKAAPASDAPEAHAPEPVTPPAPETATTPTAVIHPMPKAARAPRKAKPPTRAGLKHFGGYLDDEVLEKIALLRIRLKMDNSQLIGHAIEELYRKHSAKRAFGDA
jgi:hypothetical protein